MAEKERSVALIGSSGGGTATLGHTEPGDFVKILRRELENIVPSVRLGRVIFVSLQNGMGLDSSTGDENTVLYFLSGDETVLKTEYGTLKEINETVGRLESELAQEIREDKIHGVISVSCKAALFSQTLTAAAQQNAPVTGTGGTSLSLASSVYKVRLVGNAGGSVATTPLTKAISFSNAFSREWNLRYSPWKPSNQETKNEGQGGDGSSSTKQYPSWRSVLNSCLPAFWAVVLLKRLLLSPSAQGWVLNSSELVSTLENRALPTVCAVVMANSRSTSPGAIMGSILAASACPRTILGGLLAGWMVSIFEERLLHQAILNFNAPATMTNMISSGFVGIVVALILTPFSGILSMGTDIFRSHLVHWLAEPRFDWLENFRIFCLCMIGSVFCYGSKVGWYHSVFLPIILIEMEKGDAALFGSIDFLTLVLVSAGICAGDICSGCSEDKALMKRGMTTNILCGDFIEVCYPLMEENVAISVAGYVASAISTAILSNDCKSSAYMPFPIAIWLADDWKRLTLACFIAAGVPFTVTVTKQYWRHQSNV